MKKEIPPFEKFIVESNGPNCFLVRVAQPERMKKFLTACEVGMKSPEEFLKEIAEEPALAITTMQRCLYIEEAIREKMKVDRVE